MDFQGRLTYSGKISFGSHSNAVDVICMDSKMNLIKSEKNLFQVPLVWY
jgi:hypothetical protein